MARWSGVKMHKRKYEGIVTNSSSSDPVWWIFPKYNPVPFISLFKTLFHTLSLLDLATTLLPPCTFTKPCFKSVLACHCVFPCAASFLDGCLPLPPACLLACVSRSHSSTSSSEKVCLISPLLAPYSYVDVNTHTCKSLSKAPYHSLKQTLPCLLNYSIRKYQSTL